MMMTYRYDIPPFYECYMRHGPSLMGMDQQIDYIMTSNYTPDMISC